MARALTLVRWSLFAAYLALTIVLSSMTRPPVAEQVSDKVLHVLEFGTMAILLIQALGQGLFTRHTAAHLTITAVFGVLYGAADEIHQYFTPGRHSDVKDWAADSAATIGTVVLIALLGRLLGRGPAEGSAGPASKAQGNEGGKPRVELLTRSGCHLCEDAREVLVAVLGPPGTGFAIVDVDLHPDLASRYGEEVPVVLVDGVKRFRGRVDAERLRRLLSERGRLRTGAALSDPHRQEAPAGS